MSSEPTFPYLLKAAFKSAALVLFDKLLTQRFLLFPGREEDDDDDDELFLSVITTTMEGLDRPSEQQH